MCGSRWQVRPGLRRAIRARGCKDAKPFLVESASQFRTPGPLALTSAAYAAEVNEVKAIGSLNSSTRTPAQSHAAAFWQTNPAANYNAIARRFVDLYSLDLSDSARLFAMLDLTAADALITTWSDKYYFNFWRPWAAIRQADTDGNPATVADPGWKPMFDPTLDPAIGGVGPALSTPPYPDHPSGATELRQCQHERAGVVLRHRRAAVLRNEQPVPGRAAGFHPFLRRDERGARSAHLGRDPLPDRRRPVRRPRPRGRALHPHPLVRGRALSLDAWSGLRAAPRPALFPQSASRGFAGRGTRIGKALSRMHENGCYVKLAQETRRCASPRREVDGSEVRRADARRDQEQDDCREDQPIDDEERVVVPTHVPEQRRDGCEAGGERGE